MSDGKKKLSFLTVISTIICVVFVCEAAAPAAAIGNQQFFWWIFLILTFLLPYGMVVAELGTTYDGEGGIYDWVRDGLGDKWGARNFLHSRLNRACSNNTLPFSVNTGFNPVSFTLSILRPDLEPQIA